MATIARPVVLGNKGFLHGSEIICMAFSPDGSKLASVGWDYKICIWEVPSGRMLQCFDGGSSGRIIFHPNGRSIGNLSCQGIRFFDVETGSVVAGPFLTDQHCADWALSFDGSQAAAIGRDSIWFLNLERGTERRAEISSHDGCQAVEFLPSSQALAVLNRTRFQVLDGIEVLAVELRAPQRALSVVPYEWLANALLVAEDTGIAKAVEGASVIDAIHGVSISPEYVAPENRVPQMLRLRKLISEAYLIRGDLVCMFPPTFLFGNRNVFVRHVHWTARLWDGEERSPLRLWNLKRSPHPTVLDAVGPPVFSPGGKLLAGLTTRDRTAIRLWDTESGEEVTRLEGHHARVSSVRFSPAGDTLVSGGEDGAVCVWDPRKPELIGRLQFDSEVHHVSFSPDGSRFVAGAEKGVHICTTQPVGKEKDFPMEDPVRRAFFCPGTPHVACVSSFGEIVYWDQKAGTLSQAYYAGVVGKVFDCVPSRDGSWIVVTSADLKGYTEGHGDGIARWNLVDRTRGWTLDQPWRSVFAAAVSPCGAFVATGGEDEHLRIWKVADRPPVAECPGHGRRVLTLAFSKDGRYLASAGIDGTFALWDTRNWKEIIRVNANGTTVECLDFSPDGRLLALALSNTTVAVYDVSSIRT